MVSYHIVWYTYPISHMAKWAVGVCAVRKFDFFPLLPSLSFEPFVLLASPSNPFNCSFQGFPSFDKNIFLLTILCITPLPNPKLKQKGKH